MTTYLLAVDGGSQSTKVSIVDEVGTVHASGQAPLRGYELGPDGRAVHPDDDLWDSLVVATRATLAEFAGRPSDIAGIGLCSIRFCRALVDRDGRLTEPVLSWMDARVSQPLASVDGGVATVASAAGYLTVRLTGQRRDSAAAYRGMWPIDAETGDWSTDPAEEARTGMPRRLLPELVPPGALLGEVTAEAAEATGLPAGCPVHATANDKAVEALGAGLVGAGATDGGRVVLSLGTYITSMTAGDVETAAVVDDRVWENTPAVPGTRLYESGGIRRGMWTVSWLRDLVGSAASTVDPQETQAWLEAGAASVPAGSEGLFTLPDWLAPGDAPHRRGAILGLTGRHGAHHLHRSVLEGIAMTMHGHMAAMTEALQRPLDRVVVSGGGSRSDLLMRIVADTTGRPAIRAGMPDAAGLGAAICAAVGQGVHAGPVAAVESMVRDGPVFDPDPRTHARYQDVERAYRSLPSYTDPMFRHLAQNP